MTGATSEDAVPGRLRTIGRRAGPITLVAVAVVLLFGLDPVLDVAAWVVAGLFVVYFVRHLLFAVAGSQSAQRDMDAAIQGRPTRLPRVLVLAAVKDERAVVNDLVSALLALDYPRDLLRIVVVDDASTDGTGEVLDHLSERDRRVGVVHRPPGAPGAKSGALNAGLAGREADVVVVYDADHHPHPQSLRRLAATFDDESVGAVMGRTIVRNGDDSWLARVIGIDYLAGYLVNEYGRQAVNELPAYGGSNCAVRGTVLAQVGGWNEDTVTEDTDLTLRTMLSGYRVRYDVAATDTEEAVTSVRRFVRQRFRWAFGHQQVCRDFRGPVAWSPQLSAREKVDLTLFLYIYHMPVVAFLGLSLILLSFLGYGDGAFVGVALAALLMLGPMAELGTGLTVRSARRRLAPSILLFVPMYTVFMAVCSWAWLNYLFGRRYEWAKTAHAGS